MTTLDAQLAALGWNETLHAALSACEPGPDEVPARVVRQERTWLSVDTGTCCFQAAVTGRLRQQADSPEELPIIGDWVLIEPPAAPTGTARIRSLLPRRTWLARKRVGRAAEVQLLAAHVDLALIVVGLDRRLNPALLERGVVMAQAGGIEPLVVLNKIDLCAEATELARASSLRLNLAVLTVSTKTGAGLPELTHRIGPGRTATLLGPSGAGKSSLANALLGASEMRTGAVRDEDAKGKHTTTHRQLLRLPEGGLLIDGPGVRELGVWGDERAVASAFPDVVSLASQCRQRACAHLSESGCAVRDALRRGELASDRVEEYRALLAEIERPTQQQQRRSARRR